MWWLYVFLEFYLLTGKSDISCFCQHLGFQQLQTLYLIKQNLTLNIDSSIVTYSARGFK